MKIVIWLSVFFICTANLSAQTVKERLESAVRNLQEDVQMKHALLGMVVIDASTGEKLISLNAEIGMAPASCQKIITSVTALALLGPEYVYRTQLGYTGKIEKGVLNGNLVLNGSGDPSLGSWRFAATREETVLSDWLSGIRKAGIKKINGSLVGFTGNWEGQTIPGGWIWDDIGNYYGAGTAALNWRENQYDVKLMSGEVIGGRVSIVKTEPRLFGINLSSQLSAASMGTGDNAYIYLAPGSEKGIIRGTIPVKEKAFTISGSFPDPPFQLLATLDNRLKREKINVTSFSVSADKMPVDAKIILEHSSPPFDSLNYWFMRKSINLYGESIVKTIAFEKSGEGSTEKGLKIIREFWKDKGLEPSALHIVDGSGLSPQNRITPNSLVAVLDYAKNKPWFSLFYEALPLNNQMKLKSGTIGGAKSYAGYHTSKDGKNYIVAIIVNNYDGSSGVLVNKLFRVLDVLK